MHWQRGARWTMLYSRVYKLEDFEEKDTVLVSVGPLEEAWMQQGGQL